MSELLLIDDDQELCELLGSWLTQEGFTVRACHDGLSARQALAEHAPAAVVLDVMLPDGSGLELLKQLPRHIRLHPVSRSKSKWKLGMSSIKRLKQVLIL